MTIGEKTLHAILNCNSQAEFNRLCWVAKYIDEDFPDLFSSFVNSFVAFKMNEIDKETFDKHSHIVANSVNRHVKYGFWSLLFRFSVWLRRKS